ncbi:sensor histidine kinase [Aequorivita viscosa]|uniref:histidine kinase n=1 Tax=Aequorivita viscosa TaxID=797419 RepID=A0A1M6PEG6_9FLAO|nr:sensor histidine kinase [Aequorivita viscosa]SDX54132.1 Histidine kinase [Aequorivita viscosa]SHK06311.1 Histidine kinase [Aequorivita viscosa]
MKQLTTLFLAVLCSLLSLSCESSSEQEITKEAEKDMEAYRHSLPGYEWLEKSRNYHNEVYQDSAFYHFNHQIENKNYENAAHYLIAYGSALDGNMHYDSVYFNTAETFYNEHLNEISGESKSQLCYYLGSQSSFINDMTPSIEWFKKGITISPQSKSHKQIIGFTNFSLGQNYSRLRDFENTEKHLIEALRIFEEIGDRTNQGTVYLMLFSVFDKTNALDEAEKYLKKGLQIVKSQGNKSLTFSAYSFYVNFNISKADTIGAIKYIDSMAIHAKTYPNLHNYHKALLNQLVAFKHIAQREETEALEYLKIAKDMTDQSGSPDLQMRTLFQEIMFAEIFDKPLQNPEEAEKFYNDLAAEEDPNIQYMIQLGTGLFTYYSKKGDYKKANTYANFLLNNRDKESKEIISGKLFELERKFKTEQKENKILVQEKQLESQKHTIIALGVAAIFLILIFLMILIWNKNRSILREKQLADNFTSLLLSKTEDERKRIASDLHDSVSNELVNLRHALEGNNLSFKAKIDSILEEVRTISRNLSPTLFDKLGLKESVEQLTHRAQNQHSFLLTSEIDYNQSLNHAVELQLYRIIQEATTNMMKHSDALAGKITITEDAKFVYAEVKDNGKGFDVDKMLEKGNCFGLLNITERTKHINGSVNFKSNKTGTIIKISIPK